MQPLIDPKTENLTEFIFTVDNFFYNCDHKMFQHEYAFFFEKLKKFNFRKQISQIAQLY